MNLLIKNMPDKLQIALKIIAIQRRMTLPKLVVELLQDKLKEVQNDIT